MTTPSVIGSHLIQVHRPAPPLKRSSEFPGSRSRHHEILCAMDQPERQRGYVTPVEVTGWGVPVTGAGLVSLTEAGYG